MTVPIVIMKVAIDKEAVSNERIWQAIRNRIRNQEGIPDASLIRDSDAQIRGVIHKLLQREDAAYPKSGPVSLQRKNMQRSNSLGLYLALRDPSSQNEPLDDLYDYDPSTFKRHMLYDTSAGRKNLARLKTKPAIETTDLDTIKPNTIDLDTIKPETIDVSTIDLGKGPEPLTFKGNKPNVLPYALGAAGLAGLGLGGYALYKHMRKKKEAEGATP